MENTIKHVFYNNVSKELWNDWHWQMQNRIRSVEDLQKLGKFSKNRLEEIKKATKEFPMSITPYYASLIDFNEPECPIGLQAIPNSSELIEEEFEMVDPLAEEKDSPVPGITHRYPNRVLFYVTSECSMYCRHCTRKRKVGEVEENCSKNQWLQGLEYIKKTPEVRDVLISGGDPFLLSDENLEFLLKELQSIAHVEIVRIGTRVPVVMPQRITTKLVEILKKYQPLWLNTHFNHPKEITVESRKALRKLANAGIPLGNQSVLLRGVNDCSVIMKKLVHKLVKNRVRPYYIYQCDLSKGLSHFRTSVAKGLEIMEHLRGHTSGFAVPTYVIDAPGGGGKIPVMPNYLLSIQENQVVLRNFEGIITSYQEPINYQSKCSEKCNFCKDKKLCSADVVELSGKEKELVSKELKHVN
ncbi:MAG: lysine 2,3-aminomutase [Clostridia bacterium]|jgi:lysine 2,3-aminomutase|nr:lysine 2,3-aminomutase [Clostridia bacterium]